MTTTHLGDFSLQADAYGRARPDYPLPFVQMLADCAGAGAGDRVADIGAGTGILARRLRQLEFKVTAVEPNDAMRRQAVTTDHVTWLTGTFESTSLPDASQDWVIAAQAFHWAQPALALPEMRRILRPGGTFTVVWNERDNDRSEVLIWTVDAIRRLVPDFDEAFRDVDWGPVLISTGDFVDVQHATTSHVVSMSIDRYLNLWKSHNRLNHVAGPERFAALLAAINEYLVSRNASTIDVPYQCMAWWARAS